MRDMKGYLLAPGTLLPYLGQLLTSIYILEYSSEYLNELLEYSLIPEVI